MLVAPLGLPPTTGVRDGARRPAARHPVVGAPELRRSARVDDAERPGLARGRPPGRRADPLGEPRRRAGRRGQRHRTRRDRTVVRGCRGGVRCRCDRRDRPVDVREVRTWSRSPPTAASGPTIRCCRRFDSTDARRTLYDAIPERRAVQAGGAVELRGRGPGNGRRFRSARHVGRPARAWGAASVLAPLTAVRELECAEFVADVHGEFAAGESVACCASRTSASDGWPTTT